MTKRWVLTVHSVDEAELHRETFWTKRGARKVGQVLVSPPLNFFRVQRARRR